MNFFRLFSIVAFAAALLLCQSCNSSTTPSETFDAMTNLPGSWKFESSTTGTITSEVSTSSNSVSIMGATYAATFNGAVCTATNSYNVGGATYTDKVTVTMKSKTTCTAVKETVVSGFSLNSITFEGTKVVVVQ